MLCKAAGYSVILVNQRRISQEKNNSCKKSNKVSNMKSTPYIDIESELKREIERKTEPKEKEYEERQGSVNRPYTPPPSLGDMDKLLKEVEQRKAAAQNV